MAHDDGEYYVIRDLCGPYWWGSASLVGREHPGGRLSHVRRVRRRCGHGPWAYGTTSLLLSASQKPWLRLPPTEVRAVYYGKIDSLDLSHVPFRKVRLPWLGVRRLSQIGIESQRAVRAATNLPFRSRKDNCGVQFEAHVAGKRELPSELRARLSSGRTPLAVEEDPLRGVPQDFFSPIG